MSLLGLVVLLHARPDRSAANAAKAAFRARVLDPDFDPLAPRAEFGLGRSAMDMALFGACGEDLGDGDFVYEISEGLEDLRALIGRPSAHADQRARATILRARVRLSGLSPEA